MAIVGTLLAAPVSSVAAYSIYGGACGQSGSGGSAVCGDNTTTDPLTGTNGVLYKVTRLIAELGGAVAIIIMIIGGLMYILANGDSGKVSNAKDIILYAAVGLVVLGMGQAIVVLVLQHF